MNVPVRTDGDLKLTVHTPICTTFLFLLRKSIGLLLRRHGTAPSNPKTERQWNIKMILHLNANAEMTECGSFEFCHSDVLANVGLRCGCAVACFLHDDVMAVFDIGEKAA